MQKIKKKVGHPSRKAITFAERKLIEKYLLQGVSLSEIARLIGRSKTGVTTEVKRAGKPYSAKKAQALSDSTHKQRYKNLSEMNRGNDVHFKMKQRIENLEMQIEILHDALKELLSR